VIIFCCCNLDILRAFNPLCRLRRHSFHLGRRIKNGELIGSDKRFEDALKIMHIKFEVFSQKHRRFLILKLLIFNEKNKKIGGAE
jgi:hypothetical protein